MEITIKFIWIVLFALMLYVVYTSVNKIVRVLNSKNLMHRDIEMYKIKFSEQEILSHLEYIIDECLEYYIAMNLTPKNLYYINNQMENEITESLSKSIPERISPTLYSQLSLIYDSNQIATVIGEKIYTKVLSYVIEFNVQNDHKQIKN